MTSAHPTPTERELEMARKICNHSHDLEVTLGPRFRCGHCISVAQALSLHAKQARDEAYEKAAKVAVRDVEGKNSLGMTYFKKEFPVDGEKISKAILKLKESK